MKSKDGLKLRNGIEKIPYYEPGMPIEEIKGKYGLRKIIKLASNENPLGPSRLAIEAVRNFLSHINLYPDYHSRALRKKLSEKLEVEPDWIIDGNGSVEIIQMITEAFMDPGDEAVVGRPSFLEYEKAIYIAQGEAIAVPTKDNGLDIEGMAERVNEKTKLIFIANPNNPTGTLLREPYVKDFLDRIPENIVVVFDEAYYEYVEEPEYPNSINYIKGGRNLIVLRTFSKIYGLAGLRIGYGIARPEIIKDLNRVRGAFNTSSVAQIAAINALDDKEHVEKTKKINKEGRAYLTEKLQEMGLKVVTSYTNFVLIFLPMLGRKAFELLLREGVIVRPMDFYGLKNAIRVTVGTPEENEIFLEGMAKILAQVQS